MSAIDSTKRDLTRAANHLHRLREQTLSPSPKFFRELELTLRVAIVRIEELELENATWQNQNLAEQCYRQAEHIEQLMDRLESYENRRGHRLPESPTGTTETGVEGTG